MTPFASFGMYPFEPLRPAWEELWGAVHAHAPWTPSTLTWDGTVHERWADPACVVGHACGWPVATTLRSSVTVVGAFTLALPEAEGHRYRSVFVASRPGPLTSFVTADTTLAANSDDSLSGWVSLQIATVGTDRPWPGPIDWTGSHLESVRAVRAGRAGLASIDELTWAHIRRLQPELVDRLHAVGRGPWIPNPAVITRSGRVDELRRAFAAALEDPATRGPRATLLLTGFVPLDVAEYDALAALAHEL
jgi:ABC-type phosphate/phosphonate transport system substrate-binding protein